MPGLVYAARAAVSQYTLATETYPLDLVSGATGAWALRKLKAAYTGNAIKVRRASDNATQDIAFANFYLDFVAEAAFRGGSSTFADTWYDQTGNSRDILQATAGTQPGLFASGTPFLDIGNYPTLDWPTTAQMETVGNASNLITTTAGTVFAVVLADTTTGTTAPNGRAAWGQSGGNAAVVFQNGVKAAAFTYSGAYNTATATGLSTATAYVVAWRLGAGNIEIFVNSGTAAQTTASGTITSLASPFRVGACGGSSPWDGRIAEVICYNTALSNGDLATVGAAMASPYGITWT